MAYQRQTRFTVQVGLDLLEAITKDKGPRQSLRVDGGMAVNDWFCQFLADILAVPVERPAVLEATAQGAAFLAGLTVGVFSDLAAIAAAWEPGARFEPRMEGAERERLIAGWQDAVARALGPERRGPSRNQE